MIDARRAYQETAAQGANPVRLTILLYDQIVQDIARAEIALQSQDPEACAREIGHAVAVIGYLQATLRREPSPKIAGNLNAFCISIREKLMEAQVRSSRKILEELKPQLVEVRDAWSKVEEDASVAAG